MRILLFIAFLFFIEAAQANDTFRFRLFSDPLSLDWAFRRQSYETIVLMNVMEGLVEVDSNFIPAPALAEKWEASPDKLTYVFYLKPNVRWSDGVTLKAQDFVYAWKRVISPATKSEYASYFFDIENAEAFNSGKLRDFKKVGITALDEHRLQVKLRRETPYFLQSLHHFVTFPQRQDLVERKGPSTWWKLPNLVTLGPYRLVKWVPGKELDFERNTSYYGEQPSIAKVRALIEPDANKARELVDKNEIDLLFAITTSDIVRHTAAGGGQWHVKQFDALNVAYLGFVFGTPPSDNLEFRRAIAQALDRKGMPSSLKSGVVPADSLIPKALYGYEPVAMSVDLEQARKSLKAAGYPDPSAAPKLKLVYSKSIHDSLAEYVQSTLKTNLGLQIDIIGVPATDFAAAVKSKKYQLYVESWWAEYPEPIHFVKLMTSRSPLNRGGWRNSRYDDLVAEAGEKTDMLARIQRFTASQKILFQQDAALVPLYHSKTTALLSGEVKEFEINPLLSHLYFKNVKLK